MSQFETFKKSLVPLGRRPRVTIQKRGTITLNAGAFMALGSPEAVELLYDEADQVLGLRTVAPNVGHAAFVRPANRTGRGPYVISAMAFLRYYGFDTSQARRWNARMKDDILHVDLTEPHENVSKDAETSSRERREQSDKRRPRPNR